MGESSNIGTNNVHCPFGCGGVKTVDVVILRNQEWGKGMNEYNVDEHKLSASIIHIRIIIST